MRHDALPVKKWGIHQHFTVALLQDYHEKLVSVGVLFPLEKKEKRPCQSHVSPSLQWQPEPAPHESHKFFYITQKDNT
jgi:hypothetical protein